MTNCTKLIKNRINTFPKGYPFVVSDFADICSNNTANRIVLRLIEDKYILKIMRGVYYLPKYSNFLKENIAPDPHLVAKAIARNYGWKIAPCGDTALNILGISTQVPAAWVFMCDGAYKKYEYDNVKIIFKKTTNKNISNLSYKTSLLVQGLKSLGKNNVTDDILKKIMNLYSSKEKKIMVDEAKFSTSWVYENIKKICENYQHGNVKNK